MKTYAAVIEYLFARLPMFTRDGASAIKKDVGNTLAFCEVLGNPQNQFKTIHIAGTNGKGSSSHMLASILASAGYKTGLYTSPHLLDFRERIRINGTMISEASVIDFVLTHKDFIEELQPSFFEVTVAMAFDHFAKEEVDIAIIEVGLGGRLDSTNIITPEVCLITNIGMDHMNLLGDTLVEIAGEKAGIIKPQVPVVVSEKDPAIADVFITKAQAMEAPLCFATDRRQVLSTKLVEAGMKVNVLRLEDSQQQDWLLDLSGSYQQKNILGVLSVVDVLREQGWKINDTQIATGLSQVKTSTGLQGRWQILSKDPLVICDTGHNEDGIKEVVRNIEATPHQRLHIVIGAMRDKDLSHMLPQLPQDALYYFCSPDMPRAMPANELAEKAAGYGLKGLAYAEVPQALAAAKEQYEPQDLVFVGGSNFVVAEILALYRP
ncbi:bifunctional folylpolyglutamate synthase/dihydrofolate synthase [Sphingobacterium psychroaquaticum]|uniref:bifunctional folylpolyglutamate synthase/dihydrofolate synthase n=1 Tax=Sphingobacterium psychroaquaticum TaxID=561061 RepID=UPI00106CDAE0|nr:folylpolyglutamate synthase/dihydrofolate synthase family protein [Sphingobacterium psychroaquaticum]QBQ40512.1 bifunctional folylpolyglutamate synthase/dihydrofolate synthase [Sphingobacterium psychroaquaticum]